uniref:Uncharacterized protein n=1 Tax=Arundo donax TaxID=35708 RepID=A0A0A9HM40_ARUDO
MKQNVIAPVEVIFDKAEVSAEVWLSSQPLNEIASPPLVPFQTPDRGR